MHASQCNCLLSTRPTSMDISPMCAAATGWPGAGGPVLNLGIVGKTVKRRGASCSGRRHNIRQPFPRIARPRSRRFVAQGVTSLSASPTASHSTRCELAQRESPPSAYRQSCVSAAVAAATMREVISIHIGQAGKSRRSVVRPDCADVKKHCLGLWRAQ